MNVRISRHPKIAGSVLVTTLVLGGVLGLTLVGYLYWVRTQNVLVAQSQAWNEALALAEAGIEEGMAQINVALGTTYTPSIQTNWPSDGNGVYGPRTAALGSGSYAVIVDTTTPFPTITSTGYAVVPLLGIPVKRVVQVTTTDESMFGYSMFAQRRITFSGNDIAIDSYDSQDSQYNCGGLYCAANRKAGGDVCTTYGIVDVGNANINGMLRTGPTATYGVGVGGFVGDLNFSGPGIEKGWYENDFNMEVKEVTPPDTTGFGQPAGDSINKYFLATGGYLLDGDLELSSGETMVVDGLATLYVTGNVKMSGQGEIIIKPYASLTIYVGGPSATFTKVNSPGVASAFQYFGLPTNKSIVWGGNATYFGTVYAPQASFAAGGGGSSLYDFQGACVVDTLTLNGHFSFHFDEALKRTGPKSGYTVATWDEL